MYALFSGLWNMLFAKVQYQLLILGLDDAGKTTFLEQLKHLYSGSSPPDDLKIPPTVGLNLGKLDVNRVRFLFWDLGGQQSLRVLWDKYFDEAHAIIWILDATDPGRIDECASELQKLIHDKDLSDAPIIILANKQDLKQALQVDSIAKLLHLPDSTVAPSATSSNNAASANSSSSLTSTAASLIASATSTTTSSSSSSSSLTGPNVSDHFVRILPISALTGEGVTKVLDLLMKILPKARRTTQISERM